MTNHTLPRATTLGMLIALNRTGKNIYPGTANPKAVQARRGKAKRAKAARRTFRQTNARKGVR